MASFGGMVLTNRGRNLLAKAQAGIQLNFTRIAVGDGQLGGSSIVDLNALIHEVKSLNITKLKTVSGGKAVIGAVLSNQDISSGFYFREIGLFAQDPDVGEILYCYANCGATADYIPAGGGPDVIEKSFDIIAIVGNTSNISATINESLVYASAQGLINHENDTTAHGLAGKISHSLATAVNDFLVASGPGQFVKKTLAEVKAILGLGSAAFQDTSAFATAVQGAKADTALQTSQLGQAGGVAKQDDLTTLKTTVNTHLAETATKFTNLNLNIIDMAVELETLKGATLNGVTANIFVETFTNLNDINLMNGIYDSTNKRLVL